MIICQWSFKLIKGKEKIKFPFKFNSVWLIDPDFVTLVRSNWHKFLVLEGSSPMDSLVQKLKLLKSLVIKWERNKKIKSKEELVQLEVDLENLYSSLPGGFEREDDRVLVVEKENRKMELLKQEEETWRQKSRVIGLLVEIGIQSFFIPMPTIEDILILFGISERRMVL
jgi:hypothetical protein